MEWTPNILLKPLDEPLERDIIVSLITELNGKFNTNLDSNFSTCRDSRPAVSDELSGTDKEDIIAIIGSSHRTRTGLSMRSFGDTINGMDSSIFFASSAPGELALTKRGEDGCYHVKRELTLAHWAAFRKIFYVAIPLLRAGGNNKKLIMLPLPRYSTTKCCDDSRHLTNFGKKGYGTSMGSKLGDIQSWIEDLTRGKRIKNFDVISPATVITGGDDISKRDLAAFWEADPVPSDTRSWAISCLKRQPKTNRRNVHERTISRSSRCSGRD